jgi:HEAT repeat protein
MPGGEVLRVHTPGKILVRFEALMKKTRRVFLGLFIALAILPQDRGTAADQKEPVYQGKSLTQWIEGLGDPDAAVRREAAQAVRQIGPEARRAIPSLTLLLKDDDEYVCWGAVEALAAIGPEPAVAPDLVELLRDRQKLLVIGKANILHGAAARALGRIGPPAIPHLCRALADDDPDTRDEIARVLRGIGPAAAPELVKALRSKRSPLRYEAAHLLAEFGTETMRAIPALVEQLGDADPEGRAQAARDLERFGPRAALAIPALIRVLNENGPGPAESERARVAASAALGRIGPPARAAVPALVDELRDENPFCNMAAADALASLGPAARAAVPALRDFLRQRRDADDRFFPYARLCVAEALWKLGGPDNAVAAVPAELLRDDHAGIREAAAKALGSMGPGARSAGPALRKALERGRGGGELVEVCRALWRIDQDPKPPLPLLVGALQELDSSVRAEAADLLPELGPEAKPAVPALQEALRGTFRARDDGRLAVAEALWKIDGRAEAVLPVLVEKLRKGPTADIRERAASLLGRVGAGTAEAVPALTAALEDEDRYAGSYEYRERQRIRAAVLGALGHIGPAAMPAAPALRRALKHPDALVRVRAAETLWRIDPGAAETIPALTQALRDPGAWVRGAAAECLGRMGPAAQTVVPELVRLLGDDYETVRGSAARALGQIGPEARAAVPALLKASSTDNDSEVRETALVALSKIDPKAAPRDRGR